MDVATCFFQTHNQFRSTGWQKLLRFGVGFFAYFCWEGQTGKGANIWGRWGTGKGMELLI